MWSDLGTCTHSVYLVKPYWCRPCELAWKCCCKSAVSLHGEWEKFAPCVPTGRLFDRKCRFSIPVDQRVDSFIGALRLLKERLHWVSRRASSSWWAKTSAAACQADSPRRRQWHDPENYYFCNHIEEV
jgi:hypothetical protein